MRGQHLHLILCLLFISFVATGCAAPSLPAAEGQAGGAQSPATPAPVKLAAELVGDATNYGGALLGQIEILGGVMGRYGELLENPRMGERDWELLVNAQGAAIDLAYEGVSRINPPEPLKGLHSTAVDAAGECLAARKTAQAAMLAADPSGLPKAAEQVKSCVTKTAAARSQLVQMADANGIRLSELPISGALTLPASPGGDAGTGGSSGAGVVNETANLRSGPGTGYSKIGGLEKGARVTAIGRNEGGDWLVIQAESAPQAWIAAFLVDNIQDVQSLPVVRPPP